VQFEQDRQGKTLARCVAQSLCVLLAGLTLGACSSKPKAKPDAGPIVCEQNPFCQDSDCDTICDIEEGDDSVDTDHDGTPDYLDQDSDNDGLSDHEEAGDDDPSTPPFDRNQNGIPDYREAGYPLRAGHTPTSVNPTDDGNASVVPAPALDAATPAVMLQPEPDAGPLRGDICPAAARVNNACLSAEVGDAACDGVDNDCDGRVDNDNFCSCTRGTVRGCFAGPPGRRHVGACQDGVQVCVAGEFSHWGPCKDSMSLHAEICDGLDNDCNGCSDELPDCASKLSCPGPADQRTPDAKPFVAYELDASRFYAGNDATGYLWRIRGSPCDRLFTALDATATAQSGKLSFALKNPNAARTQAVFALSGTYEVALVIFTPTGQFSCQWVVHVRAPGLRVELCWDKTGPVAQAHGDAVDLDLHLGKQGSTNGWLGPNDCYWETCRGNATPWSYANTTPVSQCSGPGAQNYAAYNALGFCPNPRLEADNRLDGPSRATYVTENISLDNPQLGDQFRILVHYNSNLLADVADADAGVVPSIATHPIVNVYCDGELRGSFGGDPAQSGDAEEVTMSTPGDMWRVVDVAVHSDGCALYALKNPGSGAGYWQTGFDSAYGTQ
jgi:hypothetical protein